MQRHTKPFHIKEDERDMANKSLCDLRLEPEPEKNALKYIIGNSEYKWYRYFISGLNFLYLIIIVWLFQRMLFFLEYTSTISGWRIMKSATGSVNDNFLCVHYKCEIKEVMWNLFTGNKEAGFMD